MQIRKPIKVENVGWQRGGGRPAGHKLEPKARSTSCSNLDARFRHKSTRSLFILMRKDGNGDRFHPGGRLHREDSPRPLAIGR